MNNSSIPMARASPRDGTGATVQGNADESEMTFNSNHPLHGLSVSARTESRQRVFAKALAELLRGRTNSSPVLPSSERP